MAAGREEVMGLRQKLQQARELTHFTWLDIAVGKLGSCCGASKPESSTYSVKFFCKEICTCKFC